MQPDDTARLGHLHDAARKAVTFAAGRSRDDLDSDEMLTLALTKLVEIVGEAAKQVTPGTRAMYPAVPWSDAARTRDRLVHHYFDVDRNRQRAVLPDRPLPSSRRRAPLPAGRASCIRRALIGCQGRGYIWTMVGCWYDRNSQAMSRSSG